MMVASSSSSSALVDNEPSSVVCDGWRNAATATADDDGDRDGDDGEEDCADGSTSNNSIGSDRVEEGEEEGRAEEAFVLMLASVAQS